MSGWGARSLQIWGVGVAGINSPSYGLSRGERGLVVGYGGVEMKGAAGGCRSLAFLYCAPTGASILLSHAPAAEFQSLHAFPVLSLRSRVDLFIFFFALGGRTDSSLARNATLLILYFDLNITPAEYSGPHAPTPRKSCNILHPSPFRI